MSGFALSSGAAVVTGAGSGIGAALTAALTAHGMSVLAADIDKGAVERTVEVLRETGADVVPYGVDVRDGAAVDEMAHAAFERWGGVRLLVNNAGVELHGRLWELSTAQWDRVVGVNLSGVFHGVRAFVPRMLESGKQGCIVNVASVSALEPRPHTAVYGATKHAVLALSDAMAAELSLVTQHLRVSTVLPGSVATSIFDRAESADDDGLAESDRTMLRDDQRIHGMSAATAADIIAEGIEEGRSLIHTDVDASRTRLERRHAALLGTLPRTPQRASHRISYVGGDESECPR